MAKYGLNDLEQFTLIVVKRTKKTYQVVNSIEGKVFAMANIWMFNNLKSNMYADLFNSNNEWMGRFQGSKDTFVPTFIEADEKLSFQDLYQPS